jgi:hypothetical protein
MLNSLHLEQVEGSLLRGDVPWELLDSVGLILIVCQFNSVRMRDKLGGRRVYGPQGNEEKIIFIQELCDIRAQCQGPWMLAGDFNLICKAEDKNNTNYNQAMMGRFQRVIDDLALKDVPLHGRKFAWSNQQASPTLVRLDRVLSTVD